LSEKDQIRGRYVYNNLSEIDTTASLPAFYLVQPFQFHLFTLSGYLSRILKRFKSLGLVARTRSSKDGRELVLNLTSKGRKVYAPLHARANADVRLLLRHLAAEDIREMLEGMDTIRDLLNQPKSPAER